MLAVFHTKIPFSPHFQGEERIDFRNILELFKNPLLGRVDFDSIFGVSNTQIYRL